MPTAKQWDFKSLEGSRVVITAAAMGIRRGIVASSDANTVTLRNEKGQTLMISKDSITSVARI